MKLPTSKTHDIRVTQLTITPPGRQTFDEEAFVVEIVDEAGGEFVTVEWLADTQSPNKIAINKEEWPALRDAIEYMVGQCKDFD